MIQNSGTHDFFHADLKQTDPELFGGLEAELKRQEDGIELIASENLVSRAVLQAQGSVLTNKYAEGLPNKRYYGGCEAVDKVEQLAIDRVKKLFGAQFANVQPHSGASANIAVYMAALSVGDTVLGMDLAAGGHLTHGCKVNFSGKWFNSVSYNVTRDEGVIDYEQVEAQAKAHKPKMIIAGGSAYARFIDFERFREIADSVGAILFVDMSHFAGLVATGLYPNPMEHAHVVTTTTHKTLRGTRGGVILTNDEALAKKINSAVFPGLQGGPLMHAIAGKAAAFGEALKPDFKVYQEQIVKNARIFSKALAERGFNLISGGTDSHLLLIDLRSKGITGKDAEKRLNDVHIITNKNAIPFDEQSPFITSGLRVGTPAGTTRGFTGDDYIEIASMMNAILSEYGEREEVKADVRKRVKALCDAHPIYDRPFG